MTERRVYTIPQLLRLRPPTRRNEPIRSGPLPLPRRPSPSPTRSPPNRTRQHALSISPPPISSSSYDGLDTTQRNLRSSPLLPPGFGPPRAPNGAVNGPKNAPYGTRHERCARRIARGPNPSANFASRIAFANRIAKHRTQTSTKHTQFEPFSRRDAELSTEIDRLFAEEVSKASALVGPQRVSSPAKVNNCIDASTGDSKQNRFISPSSIEDAVTLASVANSTVTEKFPAEVKTDPVRVETRLKREKADESLGEVSFEELAKQLAAGASRADDSPIGGGQHTSGQNINGSEEVKVQHPETEDDDPTVAALAKWFSSLAAAADVVEGNNRSNSLSQSNHAEAKEIASDSNYDFVTDPTNQSLDHSHMKNKDSFRLGGDMNDPTEAPEIDDHKEAENTKNIDEELVKFFDVVFKRTINGDMMEWAQPSNRPNDMADDFDNIDFDIDDIVKPESGTNDPFETSPTNKSVVAASSLDDMMTYIRQSAA